MTIQLTQSDIDRITERLNSGQNNQPNYADMYQYIFDTYGSQMDFKDIL